VAILDKNYRPTTQLPISENFYIDIDYEIHKKFEEKMIFLHFYSQGDLFFISSEGDKDGLYRNYEPGKYKTRIAIPAFLFEVGMIYFNIVFNHKRDGKGNIDNIQNLSFEIMDINNPKTNIYNGNYQDKISVILDYQTQKIA